MRSHMPLPGQMTAFFDDPPPEEAYLTSPAPRPAIGGRAGTPLRHEHTVEIGGQGRRGRMIHGLLDESQRLYQSGGELSSFVFWKQQLVTLSLDAWQQVLDRAEWIEMIDHERNECWRIQTRKAIAHGVLYEAGIGQRFGVPVSMWDVIGADGTYRRRGK